MNVSGFIVYSVLIQTWNVRVKLPEMDWEDTSSDF
jgi:hypothetical protein